MEILNERAKEDNISCTLMSKRKGYDGKTYESPIPGEYPLVKHVCRYTAKIFRCTCTIADGIVDEET